MGLGLGIFSAKRRNGQDGAGQTEGSNSFIRDEETATPWLPEPLYGGLASRLSRELFGKAAVRMGVEEDLDQYESAFEFAPAPDRYNHRYYRALGTLLVWQSSRFLTRWRRVSVTLGRCVQVPFLADAS